eukprot:GDKJ01012071.1.p1 GENE.GDKJ01012071.1~~GDKJ01012071.1.p1  ORF type:complete len:1575 (+),score=386.27 GDKJ01012071.1:535-4725(+)
MNKGKRKEEKKQNEISDILLEASLVFNIFSVFNEESEKRVPDEEKTTFENIKITQTAFETEKKSIQPESLFFSHFVSSLSKLQEQFKLVRQLKSKDGKTEHSSIQFSEKNVNSISRDPTSQATIQSSPDSNSQKDSSDSLDEIEVLSSQLSRCLVIAPTLLDKQMTVIINDKDTETVHVSTYICGYLHPILIDMIFKSIIKDCREEVLIATLYHHKKNVDLLINNLNGYIKTTQTHSENYPQQEEQNEEAICSSLFTSIFQASPETFWWRDADGWSLLAIWMLTSPTKLSLTTKFRLFFDAMKSSALLSDLIEVRRVKSLQQFAGVSFLPPPIPSFSSSTKTSKFDQKFNLSNSSPTLSSFLDETGTPITIRFSSRAQTLKHFQRLLSSKNGFHLQDFEAPSKESDEKTPLTQLLLLMKTTAPSRNSVWFSLSPFPLTISRDSVLKELSCRYPLEFPLFLPNESQKKSRALQHCRGATLLHAIASVSHFDLKSEDNSADNFKPPVYFSTFDFQSLSKMLIFSACMSSKTLDGKKRTVAMIAACSPSLIVLQTLNVQQYQIHQAPSTPVQSKTSSVFQSSRSLPVSSPFAVKPSPSVLIAPSSWSSLSQIPIFTSSTNATPSHAKQQTIKVKNFNERYVHGGFSILHLSVVAMANRFNKLSSTTQIGENGFNLDVFSQVVEQMWKMICSSCEIDAIEEEMATTPLMLACSSSSSVLVKILVSLGADVLFKDASKWTPLLYIRLASKSTMSEEEVEEVESSSQSVLRYLFKMDDKNSSSMVEQIENVGKIYEISQKQTSLLRSSKKTSSTRRAKRSRRLSFSSSSSFSSIGHSKSQRKKSIKKIKTLKEKQADADEEDDETSPLELRMRSLLKTILSVPSFFFAFNNALRQKGGKYIGEIQKHLGFFLQATTVAEVSKTKSSTISFSDADLKAWLNILDYENRLTWFLIQVRNNPVTCERLIITVDRRHPLQLLSSCANYAAQGEKAENKILDIKFFNELGVGLGPTREGLSLLSTTLSKGQSGLIAKSDGCETLAVLGGGSCCFYDVAGLGWLLGLSIMSLGANGVMDLGVDLWGGGGREEEQEISKGMENLFSLMRQVDAVYCESMVKLFEGYVQEQGDIEDLWLDGSVRVWKTCSHFLKEAFGNEKKKKIAMNGNGSFWEQIFAWNAANGESFKDEWKVLTTSDQEGVIRSKTELEQYIRNSIVAKCVSFFKPAMNAFLYGLNLSLGPKKTVLLNIFRKSEILYLISPPNSSSSSSNFSILDWRLNTRWDNLDYPSSSPPKHLPPGCSIHDPPIVLFFFNFLSSLPPADLSLMLCFVTGLTRPPVGGFKNLSVLNSTSRTGFMIRGCHGIKGALPTASTCFNELLVDVDGGLNSQEQFDKKMWISLRYGQGFQFV